MKTPPPDRPFDPDDPNFDPWADDPNAPKEPGLSDDEDDDEDDIPYELPWSERNDDDEDEADSTPTPTPNPAGPVRGPAALLDSELRGEIEFEILFQQTKAELLRPAPPPAPGDGRRNAQLLGVSLVAFALSFLSDGTRSLGILIGVLFFHELGHFLAMRLFGYRDVKMFFIPFFGAAVVGTHETAAVWKRAVTYLAGPLPGIVLGAALFFAFRPAADHGLFELARWLVILNAFNLLPVVPLDGGRLMEALFLSRRPWAGTVFRALAVAVLAALVVWEESVEAKVVFSLIAAFVLLATPLTHRQARSRKVLAGHFPDMPEKLADVPKETLRQLFGLSLTLAQDSYEPSRLAATMRGLHGQAATKLAPPRVAALMVGLYLAGWAVALGTLVPILQSEQARAAAAAQAN